jgi:hypothetical protein
MKIWKDNVSGRKSLYVLHRLRPSPGIASAWKGLEANAFGFDRTAIRIEQARPNPLNLVVAGREQDTDAQ